MDTIQIIALIFGVGGGIGLIIFTIANAGKWEKERIEWNKRPEIICAGATVEHKLTGAKYLVLRTYEDFGRDVLARGEDGKEILFFSEELKKIKNPE